VLVDDAAEGNIVRALRLAHEERDVELALGLYAEHAEIRVFDHANPPHAPKVFRGKARIAEYLACLYEPRMFHRVGAALHDVVNGDGRISFNVASEPRDGTPKKRLAAHSYEVHQGKIVHQTNVEVS
jgi:SnoaL-like domain